MDPTPPRAPTRSRAADYYVLDEVEETFPLFLADWEAGRAQRLYRPERKPVLTTTPVPRFDLLDLGAYSSMALQFSRGCPFDCEFCDITKLFGRVPRTKSNPQMLAELDALYDLGWRGPVFLVDDNFIGNRREALRLLPEVAAWQRERAHPFDLFTEASVNLAEHEPLMDAMVAAGFSMVFLGIESPNPEALRKTRKSQNVKRDEDDFLLRAVRTIQRKGLEVSGGFILGLDADGPEVFDAQIEFIQAAGIPRAMVGLLTALRGTDLHARYAAEGRLVGEASGNNVEIALNFRPQLAPEVLIAGYRRVLATLYASRPQILLRPLPDPDRQPRSRSDRPALPLRDRQAPRPPAFAPAPVAVAAGTRLPRVPAPDAPLSPAADRAGDPAGDHGAALREVHSPDARHARFQRRRPHGLREHGAGIRRIRRGLRSRAQPPRPAPAFRRFCATTGTRHCGDCAACTGACVPSFARACSRAWSRSSGRSGPASVRRPRPRSCGTAGPSSSPGSRGRRGGAISRPRATRWSSAGARAPASARSPWPPCSPRAGFGTRSSASSTSSACGS